MRDSLYMRVVILSLCISILINGYTKAGEDKSNTSDLLKIYKVDKKVSDFPEVGDLSTPEAAYATIMRDYMALGASTSEWSDISVKKVSGTERTNVSDEKAQSYLNARIIEVQIYKERSARVFAEIENNGIIGFDQRSLFLYQGRWLNSGHDGSAPTLEEARETFARKCERILKTNLELVGEATESRWNRSPVSDPQAYLKPYVDFLQKEGREPNEFMMDAFKKYELVTMGEVHNRPDYWAFNTELIRDSKFAELVGTIYLELPLNHQENINSFLSLNTCKKEIVINMLRDMMDLGWPCQPTLDFFTAVWEVNQNLSTKNKLRILLVDMERPWEKIQKREDWRKYNVDRDSYMAQNILKDRKSQEGKQRHGFFITGMGHAMEEFFYADFKTPHKSAGWHLKQALGEQLFTVFQHAPVMTNQGEISGRLALGLIDTAFEQLDDRPVIFTLQSGPFGELAFDGMPDADIYGKFSDGYDAYLYLLPLESEIFSPLIEGFYSKEYVDEINRRNIFMQGSPLDENISTSEGFTAMRSEFWGKPRSWIGKMGPEDAWQEGDQWKTKIREKRLASVTYEQLTAELDKIFKGIREIDPEKSGDAWEKKFGFNYLTMSNWSGMYKWWLDVTKKHPLESVKYGELNRNKEGLPQIEVTVTLQGNITFSRVFLFEYGALWDGWQVQYGLDMHLDPQWRNLPEKKN
ncbi:MAG: hypothetical protein JXA96_04135 [Sedimentisphaerales bacterium]|nr:hypothetical protein [Sedimentisphaerales bacterium]